MPKYNSINNIPARLFFEILEEKDFNLLEPEEKEDGLEEVFSSIYDDYFLKSDDIQSKRFLELEQEIKFIEYKIQSIVQILDFLLFNDVTQEIKKTLLESLIEIGININLENDFINEVKRVLDIEIGLISNDLSFLKIEMKEIQSQNVEKVFDFYENLIGLESIHERNLDEDMTLIKFVNYKKLAVKKSEAIKKQNEKYKK